MNPALDTKLQSSVRPESTWLRITRYIFEKYNAAT